MGRVKPVSLIDKVANVKAKHMLYPLLIGERVRLNALNKADLETITEWYQDSFFLRLFDALPAYPKSQSNLAKSFDERLNDKDTFLFAIRPVANSDLLGWIEIDGILWAHGVCWLSIAIGDQENRGQGYGTEALQLALSFVFNELNLYRLQLTVFAYNTSAIALYEKLGFTHEGTYRQFLRRDGQRFDMLLYGLLCDEWMSMQAENQQNS